jgi:flagellar basal body-associated protein FliL
MDGLKEMKMTNKDQSVSKSTKILLWVVGLITIISMILGIYLAFSSSTNTNISQDTQIENLF